MGHNDSNKDGNINHNHNRDHNNNNNIHNNTVAATTVKIIKSQKLTKAS